MTTPLLPGNPYALFKDNKVFLVTYVNSYVESEVQDFLSQFEYDLALPCDNFGRALFIGEEYISDTHVKTIPFYKSWSYNVEKRIWEPPYPKPEIDLTTWDKKTQYIWDDFSEEWVLEDISKEDLEFFSEEELISKVVNATSCCPTNNENVDEMETVNAY